MVYEQIYAQTAIEEEEEEEDDDNYVVFNIARVVSVRRELHNPANNGGDYRV